MYESFFNLDARPFEVAPIPSRYFPAQAIELARQTLSRTVGRAEGPGLLIGPSGTGKTTLCHVLADHFKDSFRIAMLAGARLCTRKALLQNILFELDLPYKNLDEGELRLSLMDHLEPGETCPNGMLLVVDEADTLPLRLLEEIRIIANLVRNDAPRVHLVLAGGMRLEERFASPKLESFNQRVVARCYMHALSVEETAAYTRSQIATVGGDPDAIFSDDAFRAIHQASDGIPRLVNQICDHALIMASAGGRTNLDAAGIQEAWADLQQLPAPWTSLAPIATESESEDSMIEFGQLDDIRDQLPIGSTLELVESPPPMSADTELKVVADSETDSDSVPNASPQPEIELVIYGEESPFDESFQDEELVVDQYSAMGLSPGNVVYDESPMWELAASVANRDDSNPAETVRETVVDNSNATPDFSELESAIAVESVTPEQDLPAVEHITEPASTTIQAEFASPKKADADSATDDLVTSPELTGEDEPADEVEECPTEEPDDVKELPSMSVMIGPEIPDAGPERVSAIVAGSSGNEDEQHLLRVAGMDDREIIVVVDEDSQAEPAERPTGRAKRQEYRQLFASLRRRSS